MPCNTSRWSFRPGYRRIAAELQHRGFAVNRKRALRLMREDNLLCLRHKCFVVTTNSRHALPVYPNGENCPIQGDPETGLFPEQNDPEMVGSATMPGARRSNMAPGVAR